MNSPKSELSKTFGIKLIGPETKIWHEATCNKQNLPFFEFPDRGLIFSINNNCSRVRPEKIKKNKRNLRNQNFPKLLELN